LGESIHRLLRAVDAGDRGQYATGTELVPGVPAIAIGPKSNALTVAICDGTAAYRPAGSS
jgi:hypothetical protein